MKSLGDWSKGVFYVNNSPRGSVQKSKGDHYVASVEGEEREFSDRYSAMRHVEDCVELMDWAPR